MAARTSGAGLCAVCETGLGCSVFTYCRSVRGPVFERIPITVLEGYEGWQSGRPSMPGPECRMSRLLFERVFKTLPAPWLEKLLPFKRHFGRAVMIHSLALLLSTA